MDKIEAILKKRKGKAGPPDKASQQYRQWIEEFYKDSIAEGDRFLVTYAEHLREYHVALTINTSTTMKKAKKRLYNYFDSLDEEKFLPKFDEKLKNLFLCAMKMLDKYVEEHGEPVNPFLVQLKELLLKNYKDEEPQQGRESQDQSKKEENGGKNGCDDEEGGTDEDKAGNDGNKDASNDRKDEPGKEVVDDQEAGQVENTEGNKLEGAGRGEESSGNEDDNEDSKKDLSPEKMEDGLSDGARNGHDPLEGDIVSNVDSNKAAGGTDEFEKDEEENASNSALDTLEEDRPSDDRNGGQKEWKGPKGILFTRTRESTEALLDWIKETEELNAVLRPEPLVGSGDGNSK